MVDNHRGVNRKKMRIGINLMGVPAKRTGIHRYSRCLMRALLESDEESEYFVFGGPHILHEIDGRGRLTKVACGSKARVGRRLKEQTVLPMYAGRWELDLIHSVNNVSPVLAGARSVVTVHDITFRKFPRERFKREKTLYYKVLVPLALRRADKIISVSNNTAKDIASAYFIPKNRIRCVYNGVDDSFGKDSERTFDLPYILFVGSVEPVKNLLRVIEAYGSISSRLPSEHILVVAGPEDWGSSGAAELAHSLGIEKNVVFTGEVSDKEIQGLYKHADLFVFPSLYEGFGLPVLEAMTCGTPVITSNTSSLPEVAGDAAVLIDPCDVEKIAGAMLRVLKDGDLRRELSLKGKERAKSFTWDRCARETLKVYKEVLSEGKRT